MAYLEDIMAVRDELLTRIGATTDGRPSDTDLVTVMHEFAASLIWEPVRHDIKRHLLPNPPVRKATALRELSHVDYEVLVSRLLEEGGRGGLCGPLGRLSAVLNEGRLVRRFHDMFDSDAPRVEADRIARQARREMGSVSLRALLSLMLLLVLVCHGSEPMWRPLAGTAVAAEVPAGMAHLIAQLSTGNREEKGQAISALGHSGPGAAAALPELRPLLKSPNAEDRMASVWAIGMISEEPADMASLVTALQDPSPRVNEVAACELGVHKVAAAIGALQKLGETTEEASVKLTVSLAVRATRDADATALQSLKNKCEQFDPIVRSRAVLQEKDPRGFSACMCSFA
jgi:hypothetical protein